MTHTSLENLLTEIRACTTCADHLPLGPRPIVIANRSARILIAGQAPGRRVHASGVPWDDQSGNTLRQWLGLDPLTFYDSRRIAIVPMGFCYPGAAASGDKPPRRECRELWHGRLLPALDHLRLRILVGNYAQRYHLGDAVRPALTATVMAWREFAPGTFVLPHPSPRNRIWLKRNSWFEEELLPPLQSAVREALRGE